jgi:hypothetical protein
MARPVGKAVVSASTLFLQLSFSESAVVLFLLPSLLTHDHSLALSDYSGLTWTSVVQQAALESSEGKIDALVKGRRVLNAVVAVTSWLSSVRVVRNSHDESYF